MKVKLQLHKSQQQQLPPLLWFLVGWSVLSFIWILTTSLSTVWRLAPPCSTERAGNLLGSAPIGSSASRLSRQIRKFQHKPSEYNFTVAICCILKDAEAYMEEWIDFHLLAMDFQNIYIYDNSDNFDLQQWYQNTRNDTVYSRVEVTHYPGQWIDEEDDFAQALMAKDCVKRFGLDPKGPQHDYFAIIDDDEFIVLQSYPNYTNIRDVLNDYLVPFGGGLTMNWIMFGTSNRSIYSPLPTLKRFLWRDEEPSSVIKSIVKATDFQEMMNPHAARLRPGALTYNTKYPGNLFRQSSPARASDHDKARDILLVYHYRYGSMKEYLQKKCVRGNADLQKWCKKDGTLRTDTPDHIQPRHGAVYDDFAWEYLKAFAPKYQAFDDWTDFT
jgi:hypothetical protein